MNVLISLLQTSRLSSPVKLIWLLKHIKQIESIYHSCTANVIALIINPQTPLYMLLFFFFFYFKSLRISEITEWLGLERTLKIVQFQPSCQGQGCQPPDRLPRVSSNLSLNISRDRASTTAVGVLCQCLIDLPHLKHCVGQGRSRQCFLSHGHHSTSLKGCRIISFMFQHFTAHL